MSLYTVYMHISPSGKKYIGITCQTTTRRWGANGVHYKNNEYFYRAIQLYGWNNFMHVILADNLDKETAEKTEIDLIRLNKTGERDYGYNIKLGGNSSGPLPQSTKLKMSLRAKGKPKSDATKKKLSESLMGHEVTEKTRQKLSEAVSGDKHPYYGTHRSEETKRKISEAQRGEKAYMFGKKLSEKHIKALIARHKGVPLSQEHIQKLRDAKAALVSSIAQIDSNGNEIAVFPSASEASRVTGVERRNICSVCAGERQRAGGFRWRYA